MPAEYCTANCANQNILLGPQDGVQTPEFEDALRAFPLARRLPEKGKVHSATVQALKVSTEADGELLLP